MSLLSFILAFYLFDKKRGRVNARTQVAIRFLQRNMKFYSCTQAAICFVFFHSEIQNFTVVPKRPFVFLQQNTKFKIVSDCIVLYCIIKLYCIRSLTSKYEIFEKLFRNFKFLVCLSS